MRRIDYGLPVFEGSDKVKMNEYTEELAYALKGQIDRFGNPLTFRGVVSTINDLPDEAVAGDIYNVTEINKNYVYSGVEWLEYSDAMGNAATQEYVNDRGVAVNPTQPTTTEKVWFKKGKNLANLPYTVNNKKTITATSNDYYELTDYAVYLEAGKTYTLSFETDGTPGTSTTEDTVQVFLILNKHDATLFATTTSTTLTFNVTVTGKYYFRFDVNQNGKTHRFWNIQVEQGSIATTYEAYVDKEILLNNNNGVFEKFYSEYYDNYSLGEQKIGTWIDGKPLYRKVIKSSTFAQSYTLEIPDIAEIVNVQAIVHRKDYPNLYAKIPSRLKNSQYYIDFGNIDKYSNGVVDIDWGPSHSSSTIQDITFIIEYTKTTD